MKKQTSIMLLVIVVLASLIISLGSCEANGVYKLGPVIDGKYHGEYIAGEYIIINADVDDITAKLMLEEALMIRARDWPESVILTGEYDISYQRRELSDSTEQDTLFPVTLDRDSN